MPLPYFKSAIIAPGIVLLGADPGGRIGGEELATHVAAEFFERIDGPADRRLADQPHEASWIALPVQPAVDAERTPIAVVQVGVWDRDVRGPAVRVGGVPAMSAAAWRAAGLRRIAGGRAVRRGRRVRGDARAGQHVAGLLRRRAQKQVPEAGERGAFWSSNCAT